MMKRPKLHLLLFIHLLCHLTFVCAREIHFQGEQLTYRMEYLKLPAGEFKFYITSIEKIENEDYYHLTVEARTNYLFSPFFGVKNKYFSIFNTTTFLPRQVKKEINQRNIKQWFTIHFDHQNKMAFIPDSTQWTIPDSCLSFFSMVYYLRQKNFLENDTLRFNLDSEHLPSTGKAFLVDNKMITVPAGTFNAIEVKVHFKRLTTVDRPWRTDLLTNRMANPDAQITFWFGADKPYLPLEISFQQKGSSVKLVLTNYILITTR